MEDKLNKSLALSLSTVAILSLASTSLMADVTASLWVENFGSNDSWSVEKHPRMTADVNGDGLQDVIGFGNPGVMVSLSSGTEFKDPSLWVDNFGYNQNWRTEKHPRMMVDVNGDSQADVVGFGNAGVLVSLSTGSGFEDASLWVNNFGSNDGWSVKKHPRFMVDVNGDGQADILGFGNAGVLVSLSTGSGFEDASLWVNNFGSNDGWSVDKHPRMTADVNGDGKADIVGFGNQGVSVALSTGSGFSKPSLWVENFGFNQNWSTDKHPRMLGDINGGGKADIVGFGNQGVMVALSSGSNFSEPSLVVGNFGYNQNWRTETHPRMMVYDDYEGKADIVGFGNQGVMVALTADINTPGEKIDIDISPHILKTVYLPSHNLNGILTFDINTQSADGKVTLLDINTGRYSYLSALTSSNTSDSFNYTVTDENGNFVKAEVNIHIKQVSVTINGVVQPDFSSNLPIVIVDTGDQEIPDEPKIKGSMTIVEPDDTNRSSLMLSPNYSGYMEIEIRGSSSQSYPKKQYSVDTETWDEEDDDVSLLGMPKEHKWILQAPYGDKSLMRNYLAYKKTRQIDESKYYAVRSHYVELLTRIGDQYRYDGVYILMEKIIRGEDRLDITKLTDEDVSSVEITGGYIFKRDKIDEDEEAFLGINGTEFIYVDPKGSNITVDQANYLEDYVQQFQYAIASSDFNNSTSADYYNNWIDDDSFIVHLLSREFFRDVDTWIFSEYLHKDRSQKMSMSAVWDFNLGMGNCYYGYSGSYIGWSYDLLKTAENSNFPLGYWMERLMGDPVFKQKVKDKWSVLRNSVWSDASLTTFIGDTQNLLTESATRNFERWPNVLGQYVWPNREACIDNGEPVYCQTFDSAVNEHLKVWLLNRADWIDSQLVP